jgi:hypothetical protein
MTSEGAHVLVVAHKTAATQRLVDTVRRRAQQGPARFTLLVPRTYWDPDTEVAAVTVELAVPLLEEAAGGHVDSRIGPDDAFAAVKEVIDEGEVDEVIVSTLPERVSHWLHIDLPSRVERLGVPVTTVVAEGRRVHAPGA